MYILGISAYYHDSAAVLIDDENIIAAVQEERFTRIKQDESFPKESIKYCLEEANISLEDIDYIAFYDKPFIKFERLLETYLNEAPKGFKSFFKSMPIWLKDKLFLKDTLANEFKDLLESLKPQLKDKELKLFKKNILTKIRFSEHHQSHASSAFYPSSFENAAILTIDGVGEWTTTSLAYGNGNKITFLNEINFPHSLGLLYSAFTYYLGFKVNSGEYKVMGLAPYGKPIYVDIIKSKLIDIKEDGSFRLDMSYFNYTTGLTMTNSKFHNLFGGKPREKEGTLTQKEMDLAASIQAITEEIMIKLAKYAKEITGSNNLCLAGGVALNCVGNGKIYKEKIFENIWIQPASGDAGGALGAAYCLYFQEFDNLRKIESNKIDKMQGSYLGPKYSNEYIKNFLDSEGAKYEFIENEESLLSIVAQELVNGKVVGWHQGRMEYGPRSLGNRSIIGDPQNIDMQTTMNMKIKFRESFRPFAPSVIKEKVDKWFDIKDESPYMLLVSDVRDDKRLSLCDTEKNLEGIEKLKQKRSEIPAVTHIDYSARVQTVDKNTNKRYYHLLSKFDSLTSCPILVNTSFNVRGEPIVCSPKDSYICFMRTGIDILVLEDFILYKTEQNANDYDDNWKETFELD
ncbi:MAG: carbamoyltransferase [Halarcobacter sp.]